jgi:deoxyribonuclease V
LPGLIGSGKREKTGQSNVFVIAQNADYNETMRIQRLHSWNVNVQDALEIQRRMAVRILQSEGNSSPHLIAGLDVSVNKNNEALAAVVVLNYPELMVVETAIASGKVNFPYIPGLLSFREVPLTLEACEKLTSIPDLVMVDGQGIAHPRRIGLASHLGLFLNTPTIGCAKSPLFGKSQEPGIMQGNIENIIDNQEDIIGAVVRTKSAVKPLYISIGHKINLASAIYWVLQCCRGYRLPEPTRLAHLASQGLRK